MYERRFHLEKKPFAMTPDPGMLYLTPMHREALSGLVYAINEHKGFVVMIGEAGTGKTTLLSRLLRFVPEDQVNFSLVLNPTLSSAEFLESALGDFGITDIPPSKVQRLQRLQQFVTAAHINGKTCVLVVDEAHKLSPEVLEEIRLLTNFETAEQKLLQIVLVGQDELRTVLNREDLRQLKQRIAVRFELKPLAPEEVEAYIRYRWARAGGQELPFEQDALRLIARAAGGLPRVVNSICDNALLLIYATEAPLVTTTHVQQVLVDLDLRDPSGTRRPGAGAQERGTHDRRAQDRATLDRGMDSRDPARGASHGSRAESAARLEIPKPVAMPATPKPMRLATLDRYLPAEPKSSSFWGKWADKFKSNSMQRRPL